MLNKYQQAAAALRVGVETPCSASKYAGMYWKPCIASALCRSCTIREHAAQLLEDLPSVSEASTSTINDLIMDIGVTVVSN